jgi:hypothetical protein
MVNVFAALLVAAVPAAVVSHPAYVKLLPNGANVVVDGKSIDAIGHKDPAGGGARNAFGQSFWDEWVNKFGWNSTFCVRASIGAARPVARSP